jgi:hypothetical protein
MKLFKYFLTGLFSALTAILIFNLYLEKKEEAAQPTTPLPSEQPLPSESPSPTPWQQLITVTPTPKPTRTPEPILRRLYEQGSSNEIDEIERDVNQTDFSILDQELPEIEEALNKLLNSNPAAG